MKDDLSQKEINKLAEDLRNKYNVKIMRDNGEILVYFDGYYHLKGETYIRDECIKSHNDSGSIVYNTIIEHVKNVIYTDRDNFKEPENKINLKNGVLDINTKKLESHKSAYNFLYKFDIEYNSSQDCPKIKNFLHNITANENDYQFLQEYIGYTLLSEYKFHNFLILYGSGNNGKSTFISLIRKFLGENNVSVVALQNLETDKFSASRLYGKKANVFADIPLLRLKSTSIIKSLTGNDKISGEKKFKDSFEFINMAKLIFSANELPSVDDKSDAFWNRAILIEFPKVFSGGSDNKEILKELTTQEELSGFLNFALEGLERLLKNKTFTYNHDTTQDRWEEYMSGKSPLNNFFEDWIEVNPDKWIRKDLLYNMYDLYCYLTKGKPVSDNKFGRLIKNYSYISEFRPGVDGRPKAWKGIALKNDVVQFFKQANECMKCDINPNKQLKINKTL